MSAVTLRDGRRLAYDEYGDPDGAPLFFFHGFPNSRVGARVSHEAARRRRLRVVALDRPGYGGSDFAPQRTIGDWADDVAQTADALGIDRFAVLGYSGGGPYAAACAARLPERITAAGIVSGIGPLSEPACREGFRLSSRIGMFLWRMFPFLIAIAFWFLALFVRLGADGVVKSLARSLPDVDKDILARPEVWALYRDDVREAFRQGSRAAAHDMRLYLRRWDFDPAAIPIAVRLWHGDVDTVVPIAVRLWHGDVDTVVPISSGRYMARTVPGAHATFYQGEGHLLIYERMDEIAAAIAA